MLLHTVPSGPGPTKPSAASVWITTSDKRGAPFLLPDPEPPWGVVTELCWAVAWCKSGALASDRPGQVSSPGVKDHAS